MPSHPLHPQDSPIRAAILAGPTATGKTALAVALAQHLPLEIISADSRQVYRHLHIGTAQPTREECDAVPHHLVDFLELHETYNVTRFAQDALRLFDEIHQRGNIPLVVGGAGFYLKVLREGLFNSPFDEKQLQDIRTEVATWDTTRMIETLENLDPERLAAIHPNDRYRLSRAVEICLAAGRSVTELTREHQQPPNRFLEFRMTVPRDELHERIAARTRTMLQAGWTEEVRLLLDQHDASLPGLRSLGYPHVVDYLNNSIDESEMFESIVRDTRRLARHQEVWFRKTRNATLLPVGDSNNALHLRQLVESCGDLMPGST